MSSANGTRFVNSITTDPNLIDEGNVLSSIPTTTLSPTNNPIVTASAGFGYKSSSGLYVPLQLDDNNNLLTSSPNDTGNIFLLDVVQGNVPGYDIVIIDAFNTAVDSTRSDLWRNGGILNFPTTPTTLKISSTSASDISGGTGARTLTLNGLDSNFDKVSETIVMNGNTAVTTANTYIRFQSADVLTVGSNGFPNGTIYIYESSSGTVASGPNIGQPTDLTVIQATIESDFRNSTFRSHYTVPNGKTAYFLEGLASVGAGKTLEFDFVIRDASIADAPFYSRFHQLIYQTTMDLESLKNIEIPEKTDIKFSVVSSASGTDAALVYNLLIVDNVVL